MKSVRKYYKLLKLSKDATPEQVKAAYRRLVCAWHPDHNTHRMKWRKRKAERKIREINIAKEIVLAHAVRERERKRLAAAIAAAERWAETEAKRRAEGARSIFGAIPDESARGVDGPVYIGKEFRTEEATRENEDIAPGAAFHDKTSARLRPDAPMDPEPVDFQSIDPPAPSKEDNAVLPADATLEMDDAQRSGREIPLNGETGGRQTAARPSSETEEARKMASSADSWWALGRHRQALDAYNEAVRLNPGFAAVFNNRGVIYMELGQYHDAISDFTRALNLAPDMVNAYVNRAGAYRDLGRYTHALADYDMAIQLDPDLAEAYRHRGIIRHKLGFRARAGEDLHAAMLLAEAAVYDRGGVGVSAYFRNSFI
ncbi:MAG: tetratricopeptide repeat protein [Desulfobacterales bacterium]|nr:tetratricopeptide repeat protein [Desulfobacterales bacterium]